MDETSSETALTPLSSPKPTSSRPKREAVEYDINDSVFIAPSYDERHGEPYMVARIQDFVGKDRVRVAFYLRPRDVGGRGALHGRRLLASFHSDVVPRTFLRGKCTVKHKDRIASEDAYRSDPDCFYYNQLYDRYLHRYFDVVPTRCIQNVPEKVLVHLRANFEYVVCEAAFTRDLCDERKTCATCQSWTTPADCISCDNCQKVFHMLCLDPPLLRKPKLGFSFSCAVCSQKREEELELYHAGEVDTLPAGPVPKTISDFSRKGKAKARDSPLISKKAPNMKTPIKMTNGWPFRYFGLAMQPNDALDPHKSIAPRAASRIGARYQTPVGDDPSGVAGEVSKLKNIEKPVDRGADESVEIISIPDASDERDVYMDKVKAMPLLQQAGVNFYEKALRLWTRYPSTAYKNACNLRPDDVKTASWTDVEIRTLDEGIEEWDDDVEEIQKMLPKKRIQDVTNFIYTKRPHSKLSADEGRVSDKYASSAPVISLHVDEEDSHPNDDLDEESFAGTPPPSKASRCAVCDVQTAECWYRCPSTVGEGSSTRDKILCQECSFQWRHYGNDSLVVPEETKTRARNARAREKKQELDVAPENDRSLTPSTRSPTPEPPQKVVLPIKPCVLCKRTEPKTMLAQCQKCTLSGHIQCYGIDDEDLDVEEWLCDLCAYREEVASFAKVRYSSTERIRDTKLTEPFWPDEPRCRLCPEVFLSPEGSNSAMSALDVLKPTEHNGFVHLICAIWHASITFIEPALYRRAENLGNLAPAAWKMTCTICSEHDSGACVKCADCDKTFHVSCAWASNYRFGFEFGEPIPRKPGKDFKQVVFKETKGNMHPRIWCKSHKVDWSRQTFDLGEKDQSTKLTTMQTYAKHYRIDNELDGLPNTWRSALRLDSFVTPVLAPKATSVKKVVKLAPQPAPLPEAKPITQSAPPARPKPKERADLPIKAPVKKKTQSNARPSAVPAADKLPFATKSKRPIVRKGPNVAAGRPVASPVASSNQAQPGYSYNLHASTSSSYSSSQGPALEEEAFTAEFERTILNGKRVYDSVTVPLDERPSKRSRNDNASATMNGAMTRGDSSPIAPPYSPLQSPDLQQFVY